ncbi:E3 ubiquitin-protein ligase RNF181 isoform X2 [Pteropus medius]|uniref:E3 ubiquitin-protein ligase RNF181 isoform X2 n=1 Tax=Pteropus vampyrus TaxID=132908 RepID=UPI00196B83B2|nr:E3 ubiquitin-protein ligase RNF181 isoform X2 [Pteropus giganteus]
MRGDRMNTSAFCASNKPLYLPFGCSDWSSSLNSPIYWPVLRGRSPAGPRAAVSDNPAAMASYFDEHDCEPLDPEQEARTNMLLELARSLFNRMDFEDLGLVVDWDHHLPPPAAKTVVENLPRTVITGSQAEVKCPVCLLEFEEEETAIEMPCHHLFHSSCILPWLSKTNSCPLCRHELPTDDDTYEEHRRDKAFRYGPCLSFRLASSSRSTDLRTCMEPCTHEAAGAECWSSTSSSCTLNPH